MLNGNIPNSNVKVEPIVSEVTYSDNASDSFEYKVFSLKDIHPESSNNSGFQLSPSIKGVNIYQNNKKNDEISTNFQSRKITEEVKSSIGTSITEFKLATFNSPEGNK